VQQASWYVLLNLLLPVASDTGKIVASPISCVQFHGAKVGFWHSWHRIWIINWAKVHNSCNVQQALSCQENGTRRQAKDAIPWLPLHAARSYETQKNHSVASCVKSWLLSYSCLQVSLRCWWCFECKQSNLDHFLNGSQMFACATVEGPSMFAPAVVSVERFALGISFCSRP